MNLPPLRSTAVGFRPTLETLEDRSVPATLIVSNLNDGGAGSLRADVAAAAQGDTIQFQTALTGTLTLTTGELLINKSLTIQGPGSGALTIDAGGGGRIFNVTGTLATQVAIVGLNLINGRSANGADGGAVLDTGAALTLTQVAASGNTATAGRGGGVAIDAGSLQLQQSQIFSDAAGEFGGGLFVNFGAQANVADTLFGNDDATFGAGVLAFGSLTLTRSTVAGCTAGLDGGGAYLNGTNTFSDDTIVGNVAGGVGGGVVNFGALTLANSTVDGNHANGGGTGGGGVAQFGTLSLGSTIIAGNTAAANPDLSGTVSSDGRNLVQNTAGANGLTASDLTGVDPKLGAPADNGGPTATQLLLAGSPAIGRGSNPLALTVDQRGYNRVGSAGLDVGAVAFNNAAPIATVGSAPNVDQNSNPDTYVFTVVYTDAQAVVGASLGNGNLLVTGPNNYSAAATLLSFTPAGNGSPVVAAYSVAAPSGGFNSAAQGVYTISMQPNQVRDVQGAFVAAGPIGAFQVQTNGAPAASGDGFVRAVYRDVLNREADLKGLNGYIDLLNHGKSREWVARDIWESAEHRRLEAIEYVGLYRGQAAAAAFAAQLPANPTGGALDEYLQATTANSPEVRAAHLTDDQFVEAQYNDTLGRASDAKGKDGYVSLLGSGKLDRRATVASFIASDENHRHIVDLYYTTFLHRRGDAAGKQAYVDRLDGGAKYEDAAVSILASDEYFRLHGNGY